MPRRLMNPVRYIRIAVLLAAATGVLTPAALAQDVEHRPWSELVVVVGHDIALSLPDGYVEGRAIALTHDALEIDVQKTSNGGVYPKGHVNIPRARVSVIRLRRSDGRAPRVASQIIGQAAVMGGLFGALNPRNGGIRGSLRGAGVQIGAATAGVAIGRRLDNREFETLIRVTPEPVAGAAGASPERRACLAEPDESNESIESTRINGRRTGDWSRAHVDEHDSSDRRTAGKPVPRCGDR